MPREPTEGAIGAGAEPLWRRADLWAGLLFLACGGLALLLGADYPLGRAGRIGPGYAPRLLGWLLIGIGGALVLRAPWTHERAAFATALRPVLLVPLAALAFAVILPVAGLIAAVFACVGIGAYAAPDNTWRTALVLGALLAFFSWALFVRGLGLPLPVFVP